MKITKLGITSTKAEEITKENTANKDFQIITNLINDLL